MKIIARFALGATLLTSLSGCDLLEKITAFMTKGDLLTSLQQDGKQLKCNMNEPFLSLTFNQNNSGQALYRFPNNTPPTYVGELLLTRIGTIPNDINGQTEFEMSNGLKGRITHTPGMCEDDMRGAPPFFDYRIEFLSWGSTTGGTTSPMLNPTRFGCCEILN